MKVHHLREAVGSLAASAPPAAPATFPAPPSDR